MYDKTWIADKFATGDLRVWYSCCVLLWGMYWLLHIYVEVPFIKKHHENEPPLFDIGHIDIPEKTQKTLGQVNDWLVISVIIMSVGLIAIASCEKFRALGYVAFFTGLIYVLKTITAIATILPDSSGRCETGRLLGSCNELFFSGHVAIVFIMFILLARILDHYERYIIAAGFVICSLVAVFAVISRNHYTIDVIGAVAVVAALRQYV